MPLRSAVGQVEKPLEGEGFSSVWSYGNPLLTDLYYLSYEGEVVAGAYHGRGVAVFKGGHRYEVV